MDNFKNENQQDNEREVVNPKKEVAGAGDLVHFIAKATGVATVVTKIVGDDCGCEERRRRLNEMFPFEK